MAQVSIVVGGLVQTLNKFKLLGASAALVNGPIATFGSTLPYARYIETGRSSRATRRAGPARMFELGVKEAAAAAPGILGPAILQSPQAVGAAKRKIRDLGIERIRARTPVRSGKLRASVSEFNRGIQ